MFMPVVGLIIGIIIGIKSNFVFPLSFSVYTAMGILACMDSLFGGIYANMEERFSLRRFINGFIANAALAILLIWLGNRLSVDFSIAVIVVYGFRIFRNFNNIRYFLIDQKGNKMSEKVL